MPLILLVDDEEDIRDVVGITLESQGYDVVTAVDGKDAIAKVKKQEFDLIVLDLMMPKMNGIQVIQVLKNSPAYNHIPIIVLTAATRQDQDKDELSRKKIGVEDYVSKPFEPMDLIKRVDKILKENFREKHDDMGRYRL